MANKYMTPEEYRKMGLSIQNVIRNSNAPAGGQMMSQSVMTPEQIAAMSADFSGQERQIASQRAYADKLRGRPSPEGRTVGPSNIYVGPNWAESLRGAAGSVMGGYMAGKANKDDVKLGLDKAKQKAAILQVANDKEQRSIDTAKANRNEDRRWEVEDLDKTIAGRENVASKRGSGLSGRDYISKITDSSGNELMMRVDPYDPESVPQFLMVGEDGKNQWTPDKAAASASITSKTEADAAVEKETGVSGIKSNQKRIDGLNEEIPAIQKQVGAYYEAVEAVASGANTGPFAGRMPSFRDASVWLDNIQQELGLAKIAQYTFGSLSEAEGRWVRESSIPQNMKEEFLSDFLRRKAAGAKRMLKARQFERAYREEFGRRPKDGMVDKILYEGGFTYGVPDAWLKEEEK